MARIALWGLQMPSANTHTTSAVRGLFHPANRLKPLQAWRSVRALIADPESTGEVFKIIEALKGGSLTRAVERMQADPAGRELAESRPDIVPLLNNRTALAALPEGSLGRAYYEFIHLQDLSADGLVAASEEAPRVNYLSAEEQWMGNRLRDIHDLQHVLTGYGRDQLGELSLLSFMTTQTYNRGISFIIFMARRKYRQECPGLPVDGCVEEGRRIARACRWLPAIRWETRLAEPLQALRAELGLRPPDFYLQTRAQWPETVMS